MLVAKIAPDHSNPPEMQCSWRCSHGVIGQGEAGKGGKKEDCLQVRSDWIPELGMCASRRELKPQGVAGGLQPAHQLGITGILGHGSCLHLVVVSQLLIPGYACK